jgi:chorismate mutase
LDLLEKRMQVADKIGKFKKENNITVLQSQRWDEIIRKSIEKGEAKGLSAELIDAVFKAIHQESINHQIRVINDEN